MGTEKPTHRGPPAAYPISSVVHLPWGLLWGSDLKQLAMRHLILPNRQHVFLNRTEGPYGQLKTNRLIRDGMDRPSLDMSASIASFEVRSPVIS
jgi:hypothetical protein